jgi:hypothetical protein
MIANEYSNSKTVRLSAVGTFRSRLEAFNAGKSDAETGHIFRPWAYGDDLKLKKSYTNGFLYVKPTDQLACEMFRELVDDEIRKMTNEVRLLEELVGIK